MRLPEADKTLIDEVLSQRMRLLREIASLGRSARMNAKLKVRQPLASVEVVLADDTHRQWLQQHDELLREELNVKQIAYTTEGEKYISYRVQPNFKRLGPRVGRLMPAVKKVLTSADGAALLAELKSQGKISISAGGESIELDSDDIEVRLQAKEGWTAAQGTLVVVVLATELTPELIREGYAQDLKRLVQDRRKELGCQYTDRIRVGIVGATDELELAIDENLDFLKNETLAVEFVLQPVADAEGAECDVADTQVTIYVQVVKEPKGVKGPGK